MNVDLTADEISLLVDALDHAHAAARGVDQDREWFDAEDVEPLAALSWCLAETLCSRKTSPPSAGSLVPDCPKCKTNRAVSLHLRALHDTVAVIIKCHLCGDWAETTGPDPTAAQDTAVAEFAEGDDR